MKVPPIGVFITYSPQIAGSFAYILYTFSLTCGWRFLCVDALHSQ